MDDRVVSPPPFDVGNPTVADFQLLVEQLRSQQEMLNNLMVNQQEKDLASRQEMELLRSMLMERHESGIKKASSFKPPHPKSFNGTRDAVLVNGWINSMEQLMDYHATPNSEKVKLSLFYLTDAASNWWNVLSDFKKISLVNDWNAFLEEFKLKFYPVGYKKQVFNKLKVLKQVKTVVKYTDEFELLLAQQPDLPVDIVIDCYVDGLKIKVRTEVQNFVHLKPDATLLEIQTRALQVEGNILGFVMHAPVVSNVANVAPMDLSVTDVKKDFKKYRCFRCNEKGHIKSNCPKKNSSFQ